MPTTHLLACIKAREMLSYLDFFFTADSSSPTPLSVYNENPLVVELSLSKKAFQKFHSWCGKSTPLVDNLLFPALKEKCNRADGSLFFECYFRSLFSEIAIGVKKSRDFLSCSPGICALYGYKNRSTVKVAIIKKGKSEAYGSCCCLLFNKLEMGRMKNHLSLSSLA